MSISWRKLKAEIIDTCSPYDNIFIMVSGGVDSMFLLDFIASTTDIIPYVIHFKHGIRENDSEEVKLVSRKAKDYSFPFILGEGIGLRDTKNQEAVARTQRWSFVETEMNKLPGKTIVLTAHHYDDQIENFLMSISRGRSMYSLVMKKIHSFTGFVKYKPLLNIEKESIYKQAKKRGLKWIEDPTNQDIDHERNYFRNKIIKDLLEIRNIRKAMRSLINELEDIS